MIRFLNRQSFRKKLMLTYGVVMFFSILAVSVVFMAITREILESQALAQSRSGVQGVETRLQQIITRLNGVSDELYLNKAVERIANTPYDNPGQAFEDYATFEDFDRILHVSPEIRRIRIYVNNQTILENGQFMRLTDTVRETEAYRAAADRQGAIIWRYQGDNISAPALHLLRLIHNNERQIIGLLDIEINNSYLNSLIRSERFATILTINGEQFAATQSALGKGVPSLKAEEEQDGVASSKVVLEGTEYLWVSSGFSSPASSSHNLFGVSMLVPMASILKDANAITTKGILICALALAVCLVCLLIFSVLFSKRIRTLRQEMHRVVDGDFEEHTIIDGDDEIAHLYADLNNMRQSFKGMIASIQEKQNEREVLLLKQRQIETKLLSNQINPHFLFNTLETIRMKAHAAGMKDIADAVKMLARMMRIKISLKEQTVPLRAELGMVRDYLEIQKFRFEDRVNYAIDAPEETMEHGILPLLIQPLVENAFLHGLEDKLEGGMIRIEVFEEGALLRVRVSDNGAGIAGPRLREIENGLTGEGIPTGVGLKNVNDRIHIFYGKQYGLAVHSSEGWGTTVEMTLPVMEGKPC